MPDPISPRSLRLLQAYFDARCDIFVLAQKEKLPVLDLIRWSQSPAVQTHIAALKKLTDDSIHLRTAQARLLSLDTLEKIVKTTDDPHELRRAASVIYRGGAAMPQFRPPRPKPPDPDNPPPKYILAKDRAWVANGPGFHPAYFPPRPSAHDSFTAIPRASRPPQELPPPPPAGEGSARPEGVLPRSAPSASHPRSARDRQRQPSTARPKLIPVKPRPQHPRAHP